MLTINDLKKDNYQWVKANLPDPDKNIETISYVEKLAMFSGTDISSWDVLAMFKKRDEDALLVDKRAINKRFFLQDLEVDPGELADDDLYYLELAESRLRGACTRTELSRIEALKSDIIYHDGEAQTKQAELNQLLRGSCRNFKPKKPFHEQVLSLVKGNWTITHLDTGTLRVRTKNNIFISHKNEDHGTDFKLDMGKFDFKVDFWRGNIRPHYRREVHRRNGGTITREVYIHPHVSMDNICWGSEKVKYLDAIREGDFETSLGILFDILTQYNDDDPYVGIDSFYQQQIMDGKLADTYDDDGYNAMGYDADGFTRGGYNRDGFDADGFDRDGYNGDGNHRTDECHDCGESIEECVCEQ